MRFINFLIKPASSLCNLRCKYCFYEDEAENRSQHSMGIMTSELAERLITEAYTSIDEGGTISFAFQGGEPTVAGLDFFKKFVLFAKTHCPNGVNISFSIQTNGTLIDENWAKFFHDERFLVGLSIDGFKDVHNMHRLDSTGKGTWNRVIRTKNLLDRYDVEYNALCVVTGRIARSPIEAYNTLKKLGFRYMQFIACLDPIGHRGSESYSLKPDVYGKFLCQLFDLWYADWKKGTYHSVRLFDDYIHILLGDNASTCATCGSCGAYFVVEGDGSVYPCDFFCVDEWYMGNLGEVSLSSLAACNTAAKFLSYGLSKPKECSICTYKKICNGGCKNDWFKDESGVHNYNCAAFKMLLDYALPRMIEISNAEMRARKSTHM